MKGCTTMIAALGVALSSATDNGTVRAATNEPAVLGKELKTARTPGKVAAVLWTVRESHCTLQVVFPNAMRIEQAKQQNPGLERVRPDVQVWLLRADGTVIAPTQRHEPGAGNKDPRLPYGIEILFSFPLSADKEAVAAAIRVDDAYHIEPMSSMRSE